MKHLQRRTHKLKKKQIVVFFGDSIAKGYSSHLQTRLNKKFENDAESYKIINQGIKSETSKDALKRLSQIKKSNPDKVLITLGMNDWRKSISVQDYKANIEKIIKYIVNLKAKPIITTINPDYNAKTYRFSQKNTLGTSKIIDEYNQVIRKLSEKYSIRIADYAKRWENNFFPTYKGLEDAIHPNENGYKFIVDVIIPVLTRDQILILWQPNGRFVQCNYACPYCYYPTSVNKGFDLKHSIIDWEKAFLKYFKNDHVVFYFSYGEFTIAPNCIEILEMIGKNINWEAKITTNTSIKLDKILNTKIAKEGRLNLNCSFHPTQTFIEKFAKQLLTIRNAGIEPSIVYVMWPPQIDDLKTKYLPVFRRLGFPVHIRAFRGLYKGKKYPKAYTQDEWIKTAEYMDMASLKYMLEEVNGLGRESLLGMSHVLINNDGEVEMCDSYVGDGHYGNIFKNNFKLDLEPSPFPGLVPLAAVDDVADYVELDYKDLIGNNVLSYSEQGGVYKDKLGKIHYPFEKLNLRNKKIRDKLIKVPKPNASSKEFFSNFIWIRDHFIKSFILKKYGKYLWEAIKGKYKLAKQGKLKLNKDFWHA